MPAQLRPLRFLLNGPRAKPRLALGVALAVLAATAAWSFTRPKLYEATASYRIEPPKPVSLYNSDGSISLKCGTPVEHSEGLNTCGKIFESTLLAKRVAKRMSAEMAFDATSLQTGNPTQEDPSTLADALIARRQVRADEELYQISVTFRFSDPEKAARIATFFPEEVHAWWIQTEKEERQRAVDELQLRITLLQPRLQELEQAASIASNAVSSDAQEIEIAAANARILASHRSALAQLQASQTEEIASLQTVGVGEKHSIIPAEVPTADAYVSPNHPLNLALGLVAGLALGGLVSALAAHRATRLTTPSASET